MARIASGFSRDDEVADLLEVVKFEMLLRSDGVESICVIFASKPGNSLRLFGI